MKVNTNKPYFIQRKKGAEMYTYTTKSTILSPPKNKCNKVLFNNPTFLEKHFKIIDIYRFSQKS